MNRYYVFIKSDSGPSYVIAKSRWHAKKTASRAKALKKGFISAVCIAEEGNEVQDFGYIGEHSPKLFPNTYEYVSLHGYAR